jgi:A nuclease family of the HNH/ENDO VII superfamily with conserved AHH
MLKREKNKTSVNALTNQQKLTKIQQTKQAMYQTNNQSLLDLRLEKVPPEQQAGVLRRAAQRYRNQTGRAYNLKNPKDPSNDPRELLEYVNEDLAQGGGAAAPPATKPEPLPKKSGNGPDKKIPTLPLQTKRDTKQGGFIRQPLPEVRPTTEGEQAREDKAQSVTSKATEPSEPEPGKQEQTNGKGQKKRTKPTASSVKKAMAATRKWGTDYRKNFKEAYGSIPEGSQIHHLNPRAVYNENPLSQEWTRRGITGLNDPENLEALPQTKDAYEKSDIKVQHSGSHKIWNEHVTEVLRAEQRELELEYGGLNKVPDKAMKQTKDRVMQQLREDLFDKDLGIEKGWIQNTDNGMDRLSQVQPSAQIG